MSFLSNVEMVVVPDQNFKRNLNCTTRHPHFYPLNGRHKDYYRFFKSLCSGRQLWQETDSRLTPYCMYCKCALLCHKGHSYREARSVCSSTITKMLLVLGGYCPPRPADPRRPSYRTNNAYWNRLQICFNPHGLSQINFRNVMLLIPYFTLILKRPWLLDYLLNLFSVLCILKQKGFFYEKLNVTIVVSLTRRDWWLFIALE